MTPTKTDQSPAPPVLLSACLIVKDETAVLPDCLQSLHHVVDEVVVYDTGSSDRTVALARRAGAWVYEGYWDDDFARARNAALEHCQGEWILWIDADERFVCNDVRALRGTLERLSSAGNLDALLVDIYNMAGDGSVLGNVHRAFRLFRKETCCWYGALHEQVDLRPELVGPRIVQAAPLVGARIDHVGYTDEIVRERNKLERNLRLATAELERTPRPGEEGIPEFNMARALSAAGRPEEAQGYYEKAMRLVRKGVPFRAVLFHMVQNLAPLGRYEDIARYARTLKDSSTDSAMADFFEAVALRRLGHLDDALALLRGVKALQTEDGFALPEATLHAELAGALVEAGHEEEAASVLLALLREGPTLLAMTSALKLFAGIGRPPQDLAAALPEGRLEEVGAALILVPPVVAAPVAEALYDRLGPRPQLLAAAVKIAPRLPVLQALEWSARLRSIGMDEACPLIAQAHTSVLEPRDRLRAALTAHAAFADKAAASLAIALAPGIREADLAAAIKEVNALCPTLTSAFAHAASGPGAPSAGDVGTPEGRRCAVAVGLASLGDNAFAQPSAQSENAPGAAQGQHGQVAQLAAVGVDPS